MSAIRSIAKLLKLGEIKLSLELDIRELPRCLFPEEVVAEISVLHDRLTKENKSVLQINRILLYENSPSLSLCL